MKSIQGSQLSCAPAQTSVRRECPPRPLCDRRLMRGDGVVSGSEGERSTQLRRRSWPTAAIRWGHHLVLPGTTACPGSSGSQDKRAGLLCRSWRLPCQLGTVDINESAARAWRRFRPMPGLSAGRCVQPTPFPRLGRSRRANFACGSAAHSPPVLDTQHRAKPAGATLS